LCLESVFDTVGETPAFIGHKARLPALGGARRSPGGGADQHGGGKVGNSSDRSVIALSSARACASWIQFLLSDVRARTDRAKRALAQSAMTIGGLKLIKHAIAAALFPLLATVAHAAAVAEDTPPCSLDSLAWRTDPIFLESLVQEDRGRRFDNMACRNTETRDFQTQGAAFRLAIGELIEPGSSAEPISYPVRVAAFFRREGGRFELLGRFLVGEDPLGGGFNFAPQTAASDSAIAVRLSERNPELFLLSRDKASAAAAFDWAREAAKQLPADLAVGQPLGVDLVAMRGRLGVHRARSDDPAHPGSAYEEDRVIIADLVWRQGALAAAAIRIEPRKKDASGDEPLDDIRAQDEDARKSIKNLPAGVEPCAIAAWSNDRDPHGLNVRAEPSTAGKILGVVPPPYKFQGGDSYKSEFRIIGYRDGWFLIDDIGKPGAGYEDAPYPRTAPQPYRGRGWVRATMVGAAYANGGLPVSRLYEAPHADAAFQRSKATLNVGDSPKAVLACSGGWALVDTQAGERGWVRSLCSNQVTNCS
jgi:hypothetical protein